MTTLNDGTVVPIVAVGDSSMMMVVYGIGFIAVFSCYVLLYVNARRKREDLRLNQVEMFITSTQIKQHLLCITIGLASISLAIFGGDSFSAWSGLTYSLLGPVLGFHGFLSSRKLKKVEAQMQQQYPQRSFQQGRQGDQRQQYQRQQQRPQGERRPQGQQRTQGERRHQDQQRPQGERRPQGPPRHQDQRNQDQRQQPPPQQGGESDQSQQRRPQNPE
jgi:hypothetical protein